MGASILKGTNSYQQNLTGLKRTDLIGQKRNYMRNTKHIVMTVLLMNDICDRISK